MTNNIIEELKKEIGNLKSGIRHDKIGTVTATGDGIAQISGLASAQAGELIEFEIGEKIVTGTVLNLEQDSVKTIILGDSKEVREGTIVKSTGKILSVDVSEKFLGRVLDGLGKPKDGLGAISDSNSKLYPLERIASGVITRESVNTPLHTGWKIIDGLIPVGRGQRELIIGDRQTGKTTLCIDAIINQKNETKYGTPICIYVAIGQKESKIAHIVETLKKAGALSYTIIVSASASDSASLQYLAPYTGTAIAEFFMDMQKDVLIVYDDLSKHATAYREISLLLRRPPGREAYPGDVFYLHSRLLERSAKRSKEYGGGSITALPVIETQAGDISAYIPTNVISITDGQIFLETELFYQGTRPAVNVGNSVSRVGSSAQTKAMKKVAGTLRLELAQFRELASFAQFGQELDASTSKKIERGKRLSELLKQNAGENMPFEKQAVSIFSAVNGFLDDVAVADIRDFEKQLLSHIEERNAEILKSISTSGEISKETEELLKKTIDDFKNNFWKK